MTTTVSYRTEFECSYIQNHELHSHRYKLEVTVDRLGQKASDKVIDFRDLKSCVDAVTFDKQYLYGFNSTEQERAVMEAVKLCGIHVHLFTTDLTVESFCQNIAANLQTMLSYEHPGVRVIEVRLRETNDSYATWSI